MITKLLNQLRHWIPWAGIRLLAFGPWAILVAVSAAQNYQYGLTISLPLAAAAIASDVGKGIWLSAAFGAAKKLDLRFFVFASMAGIAAAFSLSAAISYQAETQGGKTDNRQALQERHARAQAVYDKAVADLAAFREKGTGKGLEALAIEAKAARDREAGRGYCGKKCELKTKEYLLFVERLAEARTRDATIVTRDKAKAILEEEQKPSSVDPGASLIAAFSGVSEDQAQQAKVWIAVLLVELLSLFGYEAARFVAGSPARIPSRPVPAVVARRAGESMSQDEALAWVNRQIAYKGELAFTNEMLAKAFGKSTATASRWRRAWTDQGALAVDRRGGKYVATSEYV